RVLGRRARSFARPREDDRVGLPRRLARHALACGTARTDHHGDAHRRRVRAGRHHPPPLAMDRPGHALPLARPRRRADGRRRRRRRPRRARAPRERPSARPPPPSSPPRPQPPRPARGRHLGRPAAVPVGARRAPRRDLAAPGRVRHGTRARVQRRAGPRDRPRRRGYGRAGPPESEHLMFGLDDWLVHFSDGTTLVVVVAVAVLLGLRHASDPDHLAAVTTLVTNRRGGATRLGLTWGLGHAASLVVVGVPIVLWKAYLPAPVEESAEVTIGLVIVALALWLLLRWRRGAFVHDHAHLRVPPSRTPWQAFGIGLVHGVGGSGGVGVLLLAAIHSHAIALVALVLFAACTAVSMALLSAGFGHVLQRPRL